MIPIFDSTKFNEDIFMCSVPVPDINAHKYDNSVEFTEEQISNYCQSQVHPSIQYRKDGFAGHQWWLVSTPYPHSTGVFENPCVYYADSNDDGTPPRVFTPIPNNPIVKVRSNTDVNSDPDLLIDDDLGKMFLISRQNNTIYGNAAYLQESTDGINWTERGYKEESKIIASNKIGPFNGLSELVSPSLLKLNGKYRYFALATRANSVKDDKANTGKFLYFYNGDSNELKSANDCFEYTGISPLIGNHISYWHADSFYDEQSGYIYIIASGRSYTNWKNDYVNGMWLAVSKDGGKTYTAYPRPLLLGRFYRPTATLDENRNLVIYGVFSTGAPIDASLYPKGEADMLPGNFDKNAIFLCYRKFDEIIATLENDVRIIP